MVITGACQCIQDVFFLTLLATCTQCLLNEKKVSRYTPSNLELRTSGSSEVSDLDLRAGIGLRRVWRKQGHG